MRRRPVSKAFVILSLFALILLGFSGYRGGGADQVDFPNIYIDGATGGVGSEADPYTNLSDINWSTGGDNSVYDYLNNTPAASPTIHLTKAATWREQLTVGASGTATYPIVLTSYGSGADPILNGAVAKNDAGDWTQGGSSGDISNWSETDTAGKLSNNEASARGGSGYGIQITNDSTTTVAYLRDTFASTNIIHWIFYVKFVDAAANWTDNTYIRFAVFGGSGDYFETYLKRVGTNMQLYQRLAGGDTTGYVTICTTSDTDWHKLEIHAKTDAGGDGYHKVWIDDGEIRNETGLTTNARDATDMYFGGYELQNTGTPTLYLDDCVYTDGTDPILDEDFETDESMYWYASATTEPNMVWRNNAAMTKASAKVDLDTYTEFWWDAGNTRVYVYSDGDTNPTAQGGTNTFEVAQRDHCIDGAASVCYVTIDGITSKYSNLSAIDTTNNQTNWIVQNCTIGPAGGNGIKLLNAANHQVLDNTVSYCGINDDSDTTEIAGIFCSETGSLILDGNTVSYSGRACVVIYGSGSDAYIVQNNEISNPGQNATHAYGLQLYGNSGGIGTQDDGIARYNYIHDCGHQNISIHNKVNNAQIYYNLLKDSGSFDGGDYQANISGNQADLAYVATGLLIYNNVMYQTSTAVHARHNIRISTDSKWESALIKNNIMYNGGTWGNDLTYCCNQDGHSTPPTLDYNCHYSAQADFLMIEGVTSNWADRGGGNEDAGINTDPLMLDPANDDFTLLMASPCINAGTDVGLTEDYAGNTVPQGSAPDIGAYEYEEALGIPPVIIPGIIPQIIPVIKIGL